MTEQYLREIARDMREVVLMLREVTHYIKEAESEIPEKIRRFIMYFHDVHDLKSLYHESGIEPPAYIMREIERCADRYRHILEDLFADTGTFEKVRQEMTQRGGNVYDYSHQLFKPKEEVDEAGTRENDASR